MSWACIHVSLFVEYWEQFYKEIHKQAVNYYARLSTPLIIKLELSWGLGTLILTFGATPFLAITFTPLIYIFCKKVGQ